MTDSSTPDALDLGAIDPGEKQHWSETWAQAQAADRERETAFEERVREGERRYNNDPEFHARVKLLARILFQSKRHGIPASIKAVVALEEMDGGILDLRTINYSAPKSPLDEAVREFYRLDRAEAAALQRAYDLGNRRGDAARRAQELGWRG